MDYDENYIQNMLKNYNLLKMQYGMLCKAGIKTMEISEFNYLNDCIECLTDEYKIIIKEIYLGKAKIKAVALQLHISSKTVSRIKEKAVKIIKDSFNRNEILKMSISENKKE